MDCPQYFTRDKGQNLSKKIVSLELLKHAEAKIRQCRARTVSGGIVTAPFAVAITLPSLSSLVLVTKYFVLLLWKRILLDMVVCS